MPTFRFHAIPKEKVFPIYMELIEELKQIFNVPEDYFKFELIESSFISNGKLGDGFPIIEVLAFKREDLVQDNAAKCVYKYMKKIGYNDSELYFIFPEKRYYYGNGQHY